MLEREARPGGRIDTIDLARQRVDMGACFAFDPATLPAGLLVQAGSLIEERRPIAVWDNGSIRTDATPWGCLAQMGVDPDTRQHIEAVGRGAVGAESLRGTRAYALLDALLHQIHPGALDHYDIQHQVDGLFTWYPDHWERGNAALTAALLDHARAELQLGATVTKVADRQQWAEVDGIVNGVTTSTRCKVAVIATPADVAASLVDGVDAELKRLLDETRYASYLVVALAGMASPELARFRSLVPIDGSPALVLQQRSRTGERVVLLCYYRGDDYLELATRADSELVAMSLARLASLGIPAEALSSLDESAVRRWPRAGTVLSTRYLQSRAARPATGVGRVLLAGDYACAEQAVGYGIADAINSGLQAARRVRQILAP